MCPKMKRPVKANAKDRGSDRKAQMSEKERMAEADRILAKIWKDKGLVDENGMMPARRGGGQETSRKVILPPGIDEDMLRERGVRYEGCCKQSDGVVTQHYFTITDTNKESILSTIGVNVMDDKDLIKALDIKLKSVA